MIRLANRLKKLEDAPLQEWQAKRHQELSNLQRKLGLPLPSNADFDEGLRRLQDTIERCRDTATLDDRVVILDEFRDWALSQRAKHG